MSVQLDAEEKVLECNNIEWKTCYLVCSSTL
jgi:hypothetical protein